MGGAEDLQLPCREMVKGSNLRPLERKDTRGSGGFRQPWNPAANVIGLGGEGGGEREGVILGEGGTELNLQSFVREWRRLATQPQDQYRYILMQVNALLHQIIEHRSSVCLFLGLCLRSEETACLSYSEWR